MDIYRDGQINTKHLMMGNKLASGMLSLKQMGLFNHGVGLLIH